MSFCNCCLQLFGALMYCYFCNCCLKDIYCYLVLGIIVLAYFVQIFQVFFFIVFGYICEFIIATKNWGYSHILKMRL